jgi:simple sugar transport system permease protein
MRARRIVLGLTAPVAAVLFSLALSGLVLELAGYSAVTTFRSMWNYGLETSSIISILNRAIPFYLSGLAVAIGFKMNLFNIGVEGQYRLAALMAAAVGAWVTLPPVLHVPLILLVAMATGAAWAAVPAVLKVTRGVHEVISTIMLNAIAVSISAYLLQNYFQQKGSAAGLTPQTKPLPPSGQMPSLNRVLEWLAVTIPSGSELRGFLIIAVLVGIGFYILVWRTRFGFDLRATGVNPRAAQVSGVDLKSMIMRTMVISGAIAGLVGMSDLLGFFHNYSIDFTSGLGFTGIAIALLGRNHPVGIAVGALLFAYLDRSAQILDLRGIPREIVTIMQGIILLSVVIAYEVVGRISQAQETRAAAAAARTMGEPALEVGAA